MLDQIELLCSQNEIKLKTIKGVLSIKSFDPTTCRVVLITLLEMLRRVNNEATNIPYISNSNSVSNSEQATL